MMTLLMFFCVVRVKRNLAFFRVPAETEDETERKTAGSPGHLPHYCRFHVNSGDHRNSPERGFPRLVRVVPDSYRTFGRREML